MSVTKDTEVFTHTEWRLIENEFKDWKWTSGGDSKL